MAFGVTELPVLRRALALALHPGHASAEDVQDCLRLAESLDEAMREGARLRAFLVADLARYRAALPGTVAGYLTLLEEALEAGYRPVVADLAALRALRAGPAAASLLERCQALGDDAQRPAAEFPGVPACRTPDRAHKRLMALPGGAGEEQGKKPAEKPAERPPEHPGPEPAVPKPPRPVPTPGEVFPRRKPTPPPAGPPQQRLAAG
ncbi:hypothetical protein ACIPSA_37800 [Streptomyces sp. NPDC086549]|uniref:hypothetical protein n=1 Tax=Streptomyces sp. NPDC086549 TaxID=3365752 RepID=UPI003812281B